MKDFYKKIIDTPLRRILFPCKLMLPDSCEEQPTNYRSFWEEKEIVYPAAVVRVEPGPGRYRVLLKWKRSPDPSVTEYGIYWNNSRDSSVVESISENASDTVAAYIGNLEDWKSVV